MKIVKVEIDGYRSLKNVKIQNLADINIFHGENNTGKSNIIKALEIFFSEKKVFKKIVGTKAGELEKTIEKREMGFVGKVPLEDSDFYNLEKQPIKFTVELEMNKEEMEGIKKKIEKEEAKKLAPRKQNLIKISAEISPNLITDPQETEDIYYGDFQLTSFYINDDVYISNRAYTTAIDEIEKLLMGSFSNINSNRTIINEIDLGGKDGEIGVNNIQKYLYDIHLSEKIEDREKLKEIKKKFNEINEIGEISFSVKQLTPQEKFGRFEAGVQHVEILRKKQIKIMILSPDNKLLLPIENIGSGIQQSLIIIANFIANKKALLFGIEELEANLSPRNQEIIFYTIKKMMDDKSLNINQIFITSHSVVFSKDKVKDAKVYMVKYDGKKTSLSEVKRIEYVIFFRPCQDDYVKDKLNKLYKDHGLDTNDSIDEIYARASIMEHIVDEIEKEKALNDKKKIDKIFEEYEKKMNKKVAVTKTKAKN